MYVLMGTTFSCEESLAYKQSISRPLYHIDNISSVFPDPSIKEAATL